ncbi:MAG: ribonuclease III [Alphaproteobacteria bacterium]|nr:ribonuclease III [Alphaproteobacteria bacterium]
MARARKYAELESALGYKFKDRKLIERALTHASVRSIIADRHDNERLEFLGDRVLGLAIAEMLHAALPNHPEGELARYFNRLVRGATCAAVGREVGIGDHLILSESEAGAGGRDKDTILANAVEAILGAVFIEGGFEAGREAVRRLWGDRFNLGPQSYVDAKSALQEWAQGRGLPLPRYVEISRAGPDHAPEFVAEVRIKGLEPAQGDGPSKRHAEQAAATGLLVREGVWKKDNT